MTTKWHRLRVIYDHKTYSVWNNFTDALPYHQSVSQALKDWNARNVFNSEYIEFETEKDLTMFLLRWS